MIRLLRIILLTNVFVQQFGNKVGQGQFRGKSFPTYVYSRGLKNVVREILDANFKYYPDSEGAAVSFLSQDC